MPSVLPFPACCKQNLVVLGLQCGLGFQGLQGLGFQRLQGALKDSIQGLLLGVLSLRGFGETGVSEVTASGSF